MDECSFSFMGQPMEKKDNDVVGTRLRSSNKEIDDWVIDSVEINIEITNQCRLSRYCFKPLWVTEYKTKLLVLINVTKDSDRMVDLEL